MKQIGIYGSDMEFTEEYKWVGFGVGHYAHDGETGAYYLVDGGDYDLIRTPNYSFYPGLFTASNSEITTKASAYASSDIIKIEVPLLLPTPTLRIDPPSAVINSGDKKQFSVWYDADGSNIGYTEKDVTAEIKNDKGLNNWLSNDTAVVTVGEEGLATAVRDGSTKIKVRYYRGLNAKAQINVPTLRINPPSIAMYNGDKRNFKSFYDEDGRGKLIAEKEVTTESAWSSDNSSVASVKKRGIGKGKVSALAVGNANIFASYLGLMPSSPVSVVKTPIPLTVSCSVNPSSIFLNETTTFTANVFGGTEPYSYSWTGDDGLFGTTDTVSKSYSAIGTKNATIEVKDKTTTAFDSCSVEVANNKTIGECNTVKNQCLVGDLNNIHENQTQYLWECVGTQSTDYCSLDKTTTDPSYNVSPDSVEIQVKQSFQFLGIYDSDKTDTSNDIVDVTKLAKWQTIDASVATIVYEGADAGLATCEKTGKTAVKSTYTNAESKILTSEVVLNCTPTDPPNYNLTVNIVGQGTVDGLIGICKQAKCEKSLESGTSGYLRATPYAGYSFSLSKWSGSCSQGIGNVFISDGNDDYSEDDYICDPLSMTSHKEVTVMFEKNPLYEISPSVAKTKVGKTIHFSGLWSDGERYQQDKTNVAVWKAVDKDGDDDDSIATFKSMWLEKGEAKCVSAGTAFVYSSYGGLNDKAELICDDKIVVPDHTLTVAKTGDGYGEITGAVRCDIDCDLASEDYSEGSVVKITATPVEGSSFNGWSGACSGKDSVCELTMLEDKDASASFTEDTNLLPKAYVSADNTSVDSGGLTTVRWKSDNAVNCVGEYGGSDADWVGDKIIGGFHQTSSFQPEEERVYGVTCYNKFDKDSASIDIYAGGVNTPSPSVDLFADPDEVEIPGKSKLSWLSSNTKSCEITSDDDSKKSWNNLGSFGSIDTSILYVAPKEYSYTISCGGDDGSFVEDEVVVKTKEKCKVDCVEDGKINITSSIDTITAIIVAGLTAKSEETKITVSSDYCEGSNADLSFNYEGRNGPGEAFIGEKPLPMTGVTLGDIGNFSIKNIRGKTNPGIYSIKITAECLDKDDNSKKLTASKWINLKVKTIFSSDWLEF